MPSRRRSLHAHPALRAGTLLLALCGSSSALHAQPGPPKPAGAGAGVSVQPAPEQGPTWSALKPAQRQALKPLERDWAGIDAPRKSKWLEIAERYPTMAPQDQERMQARMSEWARMTPQERSQTRLQFQGAKQVPQRDRQASWEAYQALPEEQRRELANRARPVAAAPAVPAAAASAARSSPAAAAKAQRPDNLAREGVQPKVNAVPARGAVPPPKPVAPSVVQAKPGATTTLISKPPSPPAHQPSGSPKIAATPDYVDKKTLLPQTGAQSTAPARPPTRARDDAAKP
jgi:Protein of unknown function (DUF3106)